MEIRGSEPRFGMCSGLLEIRFFNKLGIPTLAYGPGNLEVAHGPNEYVDLKDVIECAAIYAVTALSLLRRH